MGDTLLSQFVGSHGEAGGTGQRPLWLQPLGVLPIEEKPHASDPFQLVNCDIYHAEYHRRYLKMVEALGVRLPRGKRSRAAARRTDVVSGQRQLRFALADEFLAGGPLAVAIKVTYVVRGEARWRVGCKTATGQAVRAITCGDSGKTRTAPFIVQDAVFPENVIAEPTCGLTCCRVMR